MPKVTEAALRRKPDEQVLDRSKTSISTFTLTPGAREVYRRTRWSASLCRTVAHLAGFAEVEAH